MKLNLVPLTKAARNEKFVALDAYKRLSLSTALREEIGLPQIRSQRRAEHGLPQVRSQVYIFVDRANKIIAFAKPDDVTMVAGGVLFTVSKRGYVYAPAIFEALAMPIARAVFKYEGTTELHETTWHLCKLETAGD